MPKTKTTKPQTTLVTVAVTTAGPVPMKAVREYVQDQLSFAQYDYWADLPKITHITVKRDANIERPRR